MLSRVQKNKNIFLTSFLLFTVLVPFVSFAQDTGTTTSDSGLVPCSNTLPAATKEVPNPTMPAGQECDFDALMTLVNNVINFVLFKLLLPIAAIMFCYCGFMLVTAGGESSKKTKAKEIFSNVIYGVVIAVAAWLIIQTLLQLLGYDGEWIGF